MVVVHRGGAGCHDAPERDIEPKPFRSRNLLEQIDWHSLECARRPTESCRHTIRHLCNQISNEKCRGSIREVVSLQRQVFLQAHDCSILRGNVSVVFPGTGAAAYVDENLVNELHGVA